MGVGAISILVVLILRTRRKAQNVEDPKMAALRHLRRFRTPTGGWHGTYNKNHSKLAMEYEESKEERTMTLVSFRDEVLSVEEEEIGGGIVVDPNLFLHKHYQPGKEACIHPYGERSGPTPTGGWHGTYKMNRRSSMGSQCCGGEVKSISIEEEFEEIGDEIVVDPNLFLHKHYRPPSSDGDGGDGNSSVDSFHNNNEDMNYINMKYSLGLIGSSHSNNNNGETPTTNNDMEMTRSEHAMAPAYYVSDRGGKAGGLSSLLTVPDGGCSDSDDDDDDENYMEFMEESLRDSSFRALAVEGGDTI